jgi:hypothetical protein
MIWLPDSKKNPSAAEPLERSSDDIGTPHRATHSKPFHMPILLVLDACAVPPLQRPGTRPIEPASSMMFPK